MSGFEPITIGWKGEDYTVPPTKCMGLLAALEEVLAPGQNNSAIEVLAQPHRAHMTKLAKAYATALRYAGCGVSDQEVYLSLAKGVAQGGAEGFEALKTLGDALLLMFFPEWQRQDTEAGNVSGAKAPEPATSSETASSEVSMN